MPEPSITDQLRALLPEAAPEIAGALERLAQLEHEHAQAAHVRTFLERAPREGLLYPGDALKLDDVLPGLIEAGEDEQKISDVFKRLRASRPYLFGHAPASPANQKLAQHDPERLRAALRHGSLTRQVQELRRRKR